MSTYHQLTQEERYTITALRMAGCSNAEVARRLQRHPSTIGRELRRNLTHHDAMYRAEKAHSYATARRRRSRRGAHFSIAEMAKVARLIRRRYSPEQIAGVWRNSGGLSISHETIYRRIRWDKRAGGDLWRYTRIMSSSGESDIVATILGASSPASVRSANDLPRSNCDRPLGTGRATP